MSEPENDNRPVKRRRVLACDTCRRLKNRCEYDPAIGRCSRCRRLRLECSLRPSASDFSEVATGGDGALGFAVVEEKLNEHGAILNDIKELLQNMRSTPTRTKRRRSTMIESPSTSVTPPPPRQTSEEVEEDFDSNNAADRNTKLAPVNVIRNRYGVRSGLDRLARRTRDVVELGLLSEEQAMRFQEIFFARVGPWIHMEGWNFVSDAVDVRRVSPFLFAVCCLQGGRLDESFCNSTQHEELYEHCRSLVGRELLISPLPIESVCALLIMGIWSTSPTRKAEFIDSWLLSGFAAQQAMLSINFTELMRNLRDGKSERSDQRKLRLWNAICLCHLQFAIGTGRPSVITAEYLEQCPSILNTFEASLYDGITVAGVTLFSVAQELLRRDVSNEERYRKHLKNWNAKWGHLLEADDYRACILHMAYAFCQLVLARRSLDQLSAVNDKSLLFDRSTHSPAEQQSHTPSTTSQPVSNHASSAYTSPYEKYTGLSRGHALDLLRAFRHLPKNITQEVPEFLYLSVIYAVIVLAEHLKDSPHDSEVHGLIRDVLEFGRKSVSGTTVSFELTAVALSDFLASEMHPSVHTGGGVAQPLHNHPHPQHLHHHGGNGAGGGGGVIANGNGHGVHTHGGVIGVLDPAQADFWDLPQLEDIFSGAFTDGFRWYT